MPMLRLTPILAYVDPGFMAALAQFLFVAGFGIVSFIIVAPTQAIKAFFSRLWNRRKDNSDGSAS